MYLVPCFYLPHFLFLVSSSDFLDFFCLQSHRGSNTLAVQLSKQNGKHAPENGKQAPENGKQSAENEKHPSETDGSKTEKQSKQKNPARKTAVQADGNEGRKCKILNWEKQVVAEGRVASTDPEALVHFKKLGSQGWKVWIDVAVDPEAFLWKPNSAMTTIGEAVGSTMAWNKNYVAFS